jgi:hypothetical protein
MGNNPPDGYEPIPYAHPSDVRMLGEAIGSEAIRKPKTREVLFGGTPQAASIASQSAACLAKSSIICSTNEEFSVSEKVTQIVPSYVAFPNPECVHV